MTKSCNLFLYFLIFLLAVGIVSAPQQAAGLPEITVGTVNIPQSTTSWSPPVQEERRAPERVPRTIPGCDSTERCRQIDSAWQRFSTRADYSHYDKVWDTTATRWNSLEDVYVEIISSSSSSSSSQSQDSGMIRLGSSTEMGVYAADSSLEYQQVCLTQEFGWYALNKREDLSDADKASVQAHLDNGVLNNEVQLAEVELQDRSNYVNARMAPALRRVAEQISEIDYDITWHSCRRDSDNPPDCGSLHKSCLAIDINVERNPHCPSQVCVGGRGGMTNGVCDRFTPYDGVTWSESNRQPSRDEYDRCKEGLIVTDIPRQVVEAFERNGFYWGGRFTNNGNPTADAMHFEYVVEEPYCCTRRFKEISYSLTPESSYVSNP